MMNFLQAGDKLGNETQKHELENIKLEELREKHRNEHLAYRENQRKFFLEKARFLQEEQNHGNLSEQDITTLAKSLKNKGQVSCQLLKAIMNGLLDNQKNITAFLKVDGALQALLRLLSGHNEKFQLIAAQCICNLAIGNEKKSLQVLRASESYLMMHLSGKNQYVKEACVIALGNFSRQSLKSIELLMNQGFFSKLINLLNYEDLNLEAAVVFALSQLIYKGFDLLRPEDLEICLLAILPIFKNRSFSVAFLISVLSSSFITHRHLISSGIPSEALKYLLISLKEGEKEAVFFLRVISNLINEKSGNVAKNLIENHTSVIKECITCLLLSKKEYLKKECLSLIGNLLNHPVEILRLYGVELVKENLELIKLYKRKFNVTCS